MQGVYAGIRLDVVVPELSPRHAKKGDFETGWHLCWRSYEPQSILACKELRQCFNVLEGPSGPSRRWTCIARFRLSPQDLGSKA